MSLEERAARPGRRQDRSRDAAILDATLDVLAERGFDGLTTELVASRAKAGKSTLYRRWPSKTELVLDAMGRLDTADVNVDALPDTGTLRGDLMAFVRPQTPEQDARRVGILSDLAGLSRREPLIAQRAVEAAVDPWIDLVRLLISRAMGRGEYPRADAALLASVVPSIVTYRQAIRGHPITNEEFVELIDGVLLPALRGGPGTVPDPGTSPDP